MKLKALLISVSLACLIGCTPDSQIKMEVADDVCFDSATPYDRSKAVATLNESLDNVQITSDDIKKASDLGLCRELILGDENYLELRADALAKKYEDGQRNYRNALTKHLQYLDAEAPRVEKITFRASEYKLAVTMSCDPKLNGLEYIARLNFKGGIELEIKDELIRCIGGKERLVVFTAENQDYFFGLQDPLNNLESASLEITGVNIYALNSGIHDEAKKLLDQASYDVGYYDHVDWYDSSLNERGIGLQPGIIWSIYGSP